MESAEFAQARRTGLAVEFHPPRTAAEFSKLDAVFIKGASYAPLSQGNNILDNSSVRQPR